MQEFELTLNMIEIQLDNHETSLDFSLEQGINRIMSFEKVNQNRKDKVMTINLNNNRLQQIDQVNGFRQLNVLRVEHNILTSARLKIETLTELYLGKNHLGYIPDFGALRNLMILDLSCNKIVQMIDRDIKPLSLELQVFDISGNLIRYTQGFDIKNTIEELKNKNIRILDISKNPFITKMPKLEYAFAKGIHTLENLNGKSIDFLRKEDDEELEGWETLKLDQSLFESGEDSQVSYELSYRIQACLDDPSKSVEQLKKIQELVARIASVPSQSNQFFQNKDAQVQSQIEENVENFLQNSFLFAQNQQNYVEDILKCLAQLAVVQFLNFGRRCFEIVVEIVRSGKNLESTARTIIKNYSVPLISKHQQLINVPTFVLEGILRTIQERQDYQMIPTTIIKNFMGWIDQILAQYRMDTDNLREENIQRDVICLQFIAQMGKNTTFAKEYRRTKMLTKCIILFKILLKTDHMAQYIAVLDILNHCAHSYHPCGIDLLKSRESAYNFIKDLEDELRQYIFMFKKYRNSLVNAETKENKDVILLRYRKVETLFKMYGTICKIKDITKTSLKDDFLISEMLILGTIPAIHPYLINGLSIFALKLLKNKELHASLDANEMVKFISIKLQNCVPLLQYLGGDFFPPMMKHLDPGTTNITKNMTTVMNPRIHETFRSIVKLLKFYSKNAIDYHSSIADICLEVSQNLDQNHRDEQLFIALATPNDDVRLAIVQCLLTIKVSELDSKEVAKLVTLLGSYKNLGAGKTEQVISNIMMILTKIVVGAESTSQQDFITIYSENATLDALDILVRNQERDLREEEDENKEKVELSFGVVNFLKSLSKDEKLRRNLKGIYQAKCLKKSLLDEEAYLEPQYLDIEIERTYIGKQCSYLIATLFNRDSLLPYGKVSDRILIRLAENLERRPEDAPEDLDQFAGLYHYRKIETKWSEIAKNRRNHELEIWEVMKKGLEQLAYYPIEEREKEPYLYLESQHNLFYSQEGAANLLGYLFGRNSSTRTMQLKELFIDMFSGKYNFDKIVQQINTQIQEIIEDYIELINKGNQKKMLKIKGRDEQLDNILKGIPMPVDPLRGFIKDKPYFNPNKVILFPIKPQSDSKTQNAFNRDEILYGTVKQLITPKDRIVTVCAYLRIVFALLGYSPSDQGDRVAQQLATKPDFIKELTLICEWADWRCGNIAVKYLKIINFILEKAEHCGNNEFMSGFYTISKALRTVLDLISIKLQNEDKNPLKFEDLVLIKESCECMHHIIANINKITYVDKIANYIEKREELNNKKAEALMIIDQKVDEYILSQIMPFHGFVVFIEIMVWDMQQERMLSLGNVNNDLVFKLKSKMRHYLSELIGMYMIRCRGLKLEILQVFNRIEVFEKKYIRQTFLQEILEVQFYCDYQFALLRALEQQKVLNHLEEDENLKIDYFVRCFFEKQKKSYPVIIVLAHKCLLVIEVEEDIIKKKSKEFKVWIEENQMIKFKTFNVFKIGLEQIQGFYKMETEQRVCMIFSTKTQKPFQPDEKSLEAATIVFPKINTFPQFKQAFNEVDFGNDFVSQTALTKLFVQQPVLLQWVCLEPSFPLVNRLDEFNKNRYLIANDGKALRLFKADSEEWFFFSKDLIVASTVNPKNAKLNDQQRKAKAEENYFKQKTSYELSAIQYIVIDQTLSAIIQLQFGLATTVNIYFGCDQAREAFKHALMKTCGIDKFRQQVKQKQ